MHCKLKYLLLTVLSAFAMIAAFMFSHGQSVQAADPTTEVQIFDGYGKQISDQQVPVKDGAEAFNITPPGGYIERDSDAPGSIFNPIKRSLLQSITFEAYPGKTVSFDPSQKATSPFGATSYGAYRKPGTIYGHDDIINWQKPDTNGKDSQRVLHTYKYDAWSKWYTSAGDLVAEQTHVSAYSNGYEYALYPISDDSNMLMKLNSWNDGSLLGKDWANQVLNIQKIIVKYGLVKTFVNYVDASGTTVGTGSVTGGVGEKKTYQVSVPTGYQVVPGTPDSFTYNNLTAADDGVTEHTVHVVKKSTPPTPPTPANTNTTDNTVPAKQESSSTPSSTSSSTTATAQPDVPNYAAAKGAAVYATKGIYLYKNANFKSNERVAKYQKAKRVNRPMFVVTNYARSEGGALRYKVRDVNHLSKTAGRVGYITANRSYVVPVYYASMPKSKQITVISKKGVNAYKNVNLTKKVRNYKKGTTLKVKQIVKHNLTSRYILNNGDFITANKKLIIQRNN